MTVNASRGSFLTDSGVRWRDRHASTLHLGAGIVSPPLQLSWRFGSVLDFYGTFPIGWGVPLRFDGGGPF